MKFLLINRFLLRHRPMMKIILHLSKNAKHTSENLHSFSRTTNFSKRNSAALSANIYPNTQTVVEKIQQKHSR